VRRRVRAVVAVSGTVTALATGACAEPGRDATSSYTEVDAPLDAPQDEASHPNVITATATRAGDGSFTVAATISSPYDAAERYADAFRVLRADTGDVLGVRELTHPHADEQPFTRSLPGLAIPDDVDALIVEGRDLVNGWGGATATVALDR